MMSYTVFQRNKRTGRVKPLLTGLSIEAARKACREKNSSSLPYWTEFTADENFRSLRKGSR